MCFVYFLKNKDEKLKYFSWFQEFRWKSYWKNNKNLQICGWDFENFLKKSGIAGIVHQKTNPYTPQQNGVSERMNIGGKGLR